MLSLWNEVETADKHDLGLPLCQSRLVGAYQRE